MAVIEIAGMLLILGLGGGFLGKGLLELRTTARVWLSEPLEPGSLGGKTGPVAVVGTAREAEGTVTAPFSGTECLAYEYRVREEFTHVGEYERVWTESGNESTFFDLDDGSAAVRVEAAGADFRFEEHRTTIKANEEYPPRIEEFVDQSEETGSVEYGSLPGTDLSERTFIECRLDPGEEAYVYGEAIQEPTGEWGSNLMDTAVRAGESTPVFLIADGPQRGASWRVARRGLAFTTIGLVLIGVVTTLVVLGLG